MSDFKSQKEWRIRRAWIPEARKAEKEGSRRLQSEDATEDQDSGQDRRQIPSAKAAKDAILGVKK